uniref:Putative secreted protein n=1 Tax=Anopheles darlingi TaxID=43151 RepID=A0A2M4D8Y3_ANODA
MTTWPVSWGCSRFIFLFPLLSRASVLHLLLVVVAVCRRRGFFPSMWPSISREIHSKLFQTRCLDIDKAETFKSNRAANAD